MPTGYDSIDMPDQRKLLDDFKKRDKSRKNIVNTSLVYQSKEDWIKEQLNRKKKVKESCSNLHEKTDLDWLLPRRNRMRNLLVDDKHRAIYCYIPKVDNKHYYIWFVTFKML